MIRQSGVIRIFSESFPRISSLRGYVRFLAANAAERQCQSAEKKESN